MRQLLSMFLVAAMVAGPVLTPLANASTVKTATPIKHIVIIFGKISRSTTTSAPIRTL
jgi:hypothetical protein